MKNNGLFRGRFHQIIFVVRHTLRIVAFANPKLLAGILILGVIGGITIVPILYLDRLVVDTLIANIGTSNVNEVVSSVSLLVLARIVISIFDQISGVANRFMRRMLSWEMGMRIDTLMAEKNSMLDIATLENPEFKDKYTKIERESGRRAFDLLMPLTDIPSQLVGFISTISILFVFSPWVALGVLLFSFPQMFIDSKFIKKWYNLSEKMAPLDRMRGWLTYYLVRNDNFMELKLLNLTEYLKGKMEKIQKQIISERIVLYKKDALAEIVSQLPLIIFELITSVFLVFQVVIEAITIGSFQLYLRALRSAQSDFRSLTSSFLSLFENYMYVADLVWFLDLKPDIEVSGGDKKVENNDITIEFKDVWFKYTKKQDWTLKGISFVINPKDNIALVGINGAGKSTLIKLLARFYDPTKGEILVNGVDLKEYNLASWRKHMAVLFQEFESYPFSAKESIGYGDVENFKGLQEIRQAAEMTGMHGFIDKLPLKYKNPLDPQFDKGVKPSTGQRQRLGISRMLFRKNAQVIIMDEPTASVDPQAEEDIFKELVKHASDKILIFVTQRFSTVRLADRIFVMDDGKIIEQGTHKELIELDGKYAHLFKLQAKGYQ